MRRRQAQRVHLAGPVGASTLLHLALVAWLLYAARHSAPVITAPIYRVDLVAAPPGPRQAGVVNPTPPPPTPPAAPPPAPPPPRAAAPPRAMPLPVQPAARPVPAPATPSVPVKAPPAPAPPPAPAGGGPTGGRGTDVATVRTEGIEFPYPGYLENIVRQIAVRFKPDEKGALRAELSFLVHRDGSVTNIQFVSRSGVFSFDLEAQGSIEAAGDSRAFGPLPTGFRDDVLPVIFSFDPRVLH